MFSFLQFLSVQMRPNDLDIKTPNHICEIRFPFPASAEELLYHLEQVTFPLCGLNFHLYTRSNMTFIRNFVQFITF